MDYAKINAQLASALRRAGPGENQLEVFIHTARPLLPDEASILSDFGVNTCDTTRRIFTAMLSPRAIGELSSQPWIEGLTLASQLHTRKTF